MPPACICADGHRSQLIIHRIWDDSPITRISQQFAIGKEHQHVNRSLAVGSDTVALVQYRIYVETTTHTLSRAPTLNAIVVEVPMKSIRPSELRAAVRTAANGQPEVNVTNVLGDVGLRNAGAAEAVRTAEGGGGAPFAIGTLVPDWR